MRWLHTSCVRVLLGGHAMENMPTELPLQSDPEKLLSSALGPVTDHSGRRGNRPENKRPSMAVATIGLVLLASLMVGSEVSGEDDQSESPTGLPLDRVIVTATRTPEEETLIGSAFSQLTGQQLETEQFIDLKNALNTTPGAFALEGGARGGITTLSLRGNTDSYA